MPCTKCKDGKYKWGETGECKYDSKESCEKANPKKYNKMRPTPLGKKSYEEYAKELKEFNLSKVERVELGLVDDLNISINSLKSNDAIIKEVYANMRKIESQMSSLLPKAAKSGKVANEVLKSTLKKIELAEKKVAQVIKAAKELGVNPNEIKEIKEVEKFIKLNNDGWKDIKYLINFIDQLAKI